MASKLKVDELEGVTTAGSIDVTSEGGAVSTNLQQGLGKSFFCHDQVAGTTIDSFNVSSSTDNGVAYMKFNFNNNMNNIGYTFPGSSGYVSAVNQNNWISAPNNQASSAWKNTDSLVTVASYANATRNLDISNYGVTVFGDLA